MTDAAKNLGVQQRQDERRFTEQSLQYAESQLGSDAQIAGELGGNSQMQPFLSRYTLNEGYATGTLDNQHHRQRYDHLRGGRSISEMLGDNVNSANELMEQAQAAAESGDFDLANDLASQADAASKSGDAYPIIDASVAQKAVTFGNRDVTAQADNILGSASGIGVGRMVRDASEMLDYDSETSQRFRSNLNVNSERAIAAQHRDARRSIRDAGLGAGGSRSAHAFAAISARSEERFATVRAQTLSDNARYFEEYSRAWAADAFGFAQDWLQGSAGFRDNFQASLDGLTGLATESFSNSSMLAAGFSSESGGNAAASKGRTMGLFKAGLGVAAAVLGGPIGYAAAGALFGSADKEGSY
jgi:hypothetical protein